MIGGRVQGVGFRFFTEAAALRDGISGSVQNRPDGCVEIAAEGEAEAVERFERHIRHGPPTARVDRFEIDDEVPSGRTGFSIR